MLRKYYRELLRNSRKKNSHAELVSASILEMELRMRIWETKRLGDICELITKGTTPTSIGFNFQDQGINFVKIETFTEDGHLVENKVAHISEECHNALKRSQLQENDILFSIAGALGRTAIVEKSILPANTNQALAIIRPFDKNPSFLKYLLYFFNSDFVLKQIEKDKGGVAQQNLSLKQISDFNIHIPPLEEQKRIVKILDEKFAQLETVKANAKANLQNAKDLFQSQLTKAFSKNSWEKKKLGDICSKIGSGATPKGGKDSYKSEGIHLVRSMNVYDNEFVYDELACLDDNQAYELRNVELQENDVLFNITGASVCRCCVLPSDVLPARVNQHVSILRINHKILNPLFLCYSMIGPYHEELYKMACSGGSTRQAITKKQLEDFEVYVPSLEEQQIMIERIDSLSEKVRSLEEIYTKQLANCDELKQAFLAKAFAGEL